MGELTKLGSLINWPDKESFLASLVEWNCPTCGEEVSAPRNRQVVDRRCMACVQNPRRKLTRDQQLAVAGVPQRYRQPFSERRWPAGATEWKGEPWAIGFVGLSQTGKTMMATELFWRQIERATLAGRPWAALWASASSLADSGFGNGSDRELYDKALKVRLLLIDDLGWGGGTEKLFALISDRHGAMLPTIWTANARLEDLAKGATGQPLLRRLEEDGMICGVTGKYRATTKGAV